MTTSVVWFRRDLRLHDHPALTAAQADGDRIAPLFVIDERLRAGRFRSANRLWFMRGSVSALAMALEVRGTPLSVVRGDPEEIVLAFAAAVGAARVVVSRDYTPYGRGATTGSRRHSVGAASRGARLPGLLIHEPEDVATANGQPFRMFGPFQRAGSSDPNATSWRRPMRSRVSAQSTVVGSKISSRPSRPAPIQRRCRPPERTPLASASLAGLRRGHSIGTRPTGTGSTSRGRPDSARTCAGASSHRSTRERCAGLAEGRRRFLERARVA